MAEPPISLPCNPDEAIAIRFYNHNHTPVEIFWITLSGEYEKFYTLPGKQYLDVNTYMRHSWVIKEVGTGRLVRANDDMYFYPANQYGHLSPERRTSRRYVVFLAHSLVFKLEKICIYALTKYISRCTDVKYLEIPVVLKRRLIKRLHVLRPASHSTDVDRLRCENNLIDFSRVP